MIEKTFSTKSRDKALEEIAPKTGDVLLTAWTPTEDSYSIRLKRFKDCGKKTRAGIVPYPDRNVMMVELVLLCPAAIPERLRDVVLRRCCRVLVSEFTLRYGNRNVQFARIREDRLEFGFVPLVDGEIAASRCFNDKKDVRPLLEKMNEALKCIEGYPDGGIYPTFFEYLKLKYGKAGEKA